MSGLSNTPYGATLAQDVARKLLQVRGIFYTHRDYCGMGLWMEGSNFCYGEVWDGYPSTLQLTFDGEREFVTWLAAQSDWSMSGFDEQNAWLPNNQRITRARLEAALE